MARVFTGKPDPKSKDRSCVRRSDLTRLPCMSMVPCSTMLTGLRQRFGILSSCESGNGSIQPFLTSSRKNVARASGFCVAPPWLPLVWAAARSLKRRRSINGFEGELCSYCEHASDAMPQRVPLENRVHEGNGTELIAWVSDAATVSHDDAVHVKRCPLEDSEVVVCCVLGHCEPKWSFVSWRWFPRECP